MIKGAFSEKCLSVKAQGLKKFQWSLLCCGIQAEIPKLSQATCTKLTQATSTLEKEGEEDTETADRGQVQNSTKGGEAEQPQACKAENSKGEPSRGPYLIESMLKQRRRTQNLLKNVPNVTASLVVRQMGRGAPKPMDSSHGSIQKSNPKLILVAAV